MNFVTMSGVLESENLDGVGGTARRLRPVAMLGALYREAGHLALHDPRRRAEPALGEELIADLDDGEPKSCVERVRGPARLFSRSAISSRAKGWPVGGR